MTTTRQTTVELERSVTQLRGRNVSECPKGHHLRTHWLVLDRSTHVLWSLGDRCSTLVLPLSCCAIFVVHVDLTSQSDPCCGPCWIDTLWFPSLDQEDVIYPKRICSTSRLTNDSRFLRTLLGSSWRQSTSSSLYYILRQIDSSATSIRTWFTSWTALRLSWLELWH